jgi:hypothetical protein
MDKNYSDTVTCILRALHTRVSTLESITKGYATTNDICGETTLPYGTRGVHKLIKLYEKIKFDQKDQDSPWGFLDGSETKISGLGWSHGMRVPFEIHLDNGVYIVLIGMRGSYEFHMEDAEYPKRCATISEVVNYLNREFRID